MSQTLNDILKGENINLEDPHHSDEHPCQEHFSDRNQLIWKHKCHYFVIGGGIWVSDPDLFRALKKHRRNAPNCGIARVWFIPLEMAEAEYVIDGDSGVPRVYGRELIAEIIYGKRR